MKLYSSLVAAAIAFVAAPAGAAAVPTSLPATVNPTPNLGFDTLWDLQKMFWTRFQYPNNIEEAKAINSTIFSEDVQGRVSDTRNFEGRELNTEYIFALFTPTDSISVIGRPHNYTILQFSGTKNIASASTRVNFTFPAFNNIQFPVVIDTWLSWNSEHQITQYDVVFRWFGYLLQTLIMSVNPEDPEKALGEVVTRLAGSICTSHEKYCITDETRQYADKNECFDFLTKQTRVGQSFELGMDTLLCRSVHEVMVKTRPDVHCAHIGKDGGGMCDDTISYRTKAGETYFRNSPWVPKRLMSGGH